MMLFINFELFRRLIDKLKPSLFCIFGLCVPLFGQPEAKDVNQTMSFEEIFFNLDTFLFKEIKDRLEFEFLLTGQTRTEKEEEAMSKRAALIRSGHQRLYQALSRVDDQFDQGELAVQLEKDSFRHLRVLSGDYGSPRRNIWVNLDRTKSCFGRAVFARTISTPTTDLSIIEPRKAFLGNLVIDHDFFSQFDKYFDKIKVVQDDLLEVLGTNPDSDSESLLHKNFDLYLHRIFDYDKKNKYRVLNDLKKKCSTHNKDSRICNLNLVGLLLAKAGYLVIDAFVFRQSCKYLVRHNHWENGVQRFGLRDHIDNFRKLSTVENCFGDGLGAIPGNLAGLALPLRDVKNICFGTRDWVIAIKKSFRQSGAMSEVFQAYAQISEIVKSLEPEQRAALNLFEKSAQDLSQDINRDLDWLISNLQDLKKLKRNPGVFLKAYKLIYDLRANMGYVFASLGQLDAYLSMARLFKELLEKKNGLCFTEFVQSPHPIIKIDASWDPSLDPEIAVPSDVELGGNGQFHNGILTGPNTGGKSTFMRSPFLNLLLSLTFGVGCAQRIEMTMFHGIFSYMNVIDNPAEGMSLYYAEAHTVAIAFEKIKKLSEAGKFSFFIVDEMFSGTNPRDARSILESICQEVVGLPNSVWIISTHLPGAAQSIVDGTRGRFGGLMVRFSENADGVLVPEHKVVKGISTQSTAFDVAIAAGLDKKLIANARRIKERLS